MLVKELLSLNLPQLFNLPVPFVGKISGSPPLTFWENKVKLNHHSLCKVGEIEL